MFSSGSEGHDGDVDDNNSGKVVNIVVSIASRARAEARHIIQIYM